MKKSIAAAAMSALAIAGLVVPAMAADEAAQPYVPQEGDDVVVYTHVFKPEHFDEAKRIVAEEFTAAMEELGQTRYTLWIENPSTYEVIAVSVFGEGSTVEDWQEYAGRLEVLETLEPMRQAPMVVERFDTYGITSTD